MTCKNYTLKLHVVTVSDFPETVASSKNAAQAPLLCITSTVAQGQTGWSP